MSTWDDLRGWLDQRDNDHTAAVTSADHAGYARGHQAGHTLGREEGYATGYSEGYAAGRAEQPAPARVPHRMQVGAALGYRQAGRGAAYVLDYHDRCGPITITRNYDAAVRLRGGVRGLALIGGSTGDPAGPEHNVTAGIEWDEPADMTHASNAVLAVSHRVRIP